MLVQARQTALLPLLHGGSVGGGLTAKELYEPGSGSSGTAKPAGQKGTQSCFWVRRRSIKCHVKPRVEKLLNQVHQPSARISVLKCSHV